MAATKTSQPKARIALFRINKTNLKRNIYEVDARGRKKKTLHVPRRRESLQERLAREAREREAREAAKKAREAAKEKKRSDQYLANLDDFITKVAARRHDSPDRLSGDEYEPPEHTPAATFRRTPGKRR
ncbi:hypothetical protein HA402_004151 [Bradysia odoriphaga]|nr:hypothetical protein HA402_004151 [Bradysia odoriphaga]